MSRCRLTLSGLHQFVQGRCRVCFTSEARASLEGDRDGETYDRERDEVRLNAQAKRVYDVVKDGIARTPKELEAATGDEWASISARLRDLRKSRYGGHHVERVSLGGGLFSYQLITGDRREASDERVLATEVTQGEHARGSSIERTTARPA